MLNNLIYDKINSKIIKLVSISKKKKYWKIKNYKKTKNYIKNNKIKSKIIFLYFNILLISFYYFK